MTTTETDKTPLAIAKDVARFLRDEFGATRVLLFGSAVSGNYTPRYSDIDIYFEGVPVESVDEVTGRAMWRFAHYDLDFWPEARCRPPFRARILESGIAI